MNSASCDTSGKFRAGGVCVLILCGLLVSVMGAACGGADEQTPTETAGEPNVLAVASLRTLATWDPRAAAGDEFFFMLNVYEPLLRANPQGSDEEYEPVLATSWEGSDDGMTWTFHLREGVTFHDGTPFNAEAVKYSIDATREYDQGAAWIWSVVDSIAVVDEYTVDITCTDPVNLPRIAASMAGAHMFSPATKDETPDWWEAPNEAGTGPYKLASYTPNDETVLEQNPDYWGGWTTSQFEEIVIKYVSETGTARQMLEAGEVDFTDYLARDAVSAMESNPDVTLLTIPGTRTEFLMFNTERKPLDNVEVRQALSYALPYEDILEAGASGVGRVARGPLAASVYPHDPNCPQYTYDPEKARDLLAEAGYPDGGFTLTLTYGSDSQFGPDFVALIKEAYADVGVTVDIQPLLFQQQWDKAKGPADKRQDLMEVGWWPDYPSGQEQLYALFHSEDEPYWNLSYWDNPDFDELIDTAFVSEVSDPSRAQELYNESQRLLVEQAPAAFLIEPDSVFGLNPSLRLEPNATNPYYTGAAFFYRFSK